MFDGFSHVRWCSSSHPELASLTKTKLDGLLTQVESSLYKSDKTTTVAKVELGQCSVVLKRYNDRSVWHIIKKALRTTRARRCWQMSEAYGKAGLNVAAPILMYESRLGFIRRHSYFASEFLQGELLLDHLAQLDQCQQQEVALAIQDAFAKMKKHRLSHGDLKATNLIWFEQKLYFIDLDGASQHRTEWGWQRANNRDRKRFLKNWKDEAVLQNLFLDLVY